MAEANVIEASIDNCIAKTDQQFGLTAQFNDQSSYLGGNYPRFDLQKDLNEKYNIQGSPTVVINDTVVEINPRTPEGLKAIVCQAFNNPPAECSQTLSTAVPGAGLGETAPAASGSCQ